MEDEHQIPIWLFIGGVLTVYGVLILGAGVYGLFSPPDVKLYSLHADLWWGVLLTIVGSGYVWKFWPWRGNKPEGPK
jgi:hypothetical protein